MIPGNRISTFAFEKKKRLPRCFPLFFLLPVGLGGHGTAQKKSSPAVNPKPFAKTNHNPIVRLPQAEFAQVLHTGRLVAEEHLTDWNVKVFRCSNGPGNPDMEYRNQTDFLYISTARDGFPPKFCLFRVGPLSPEVSVRLLDKKQKNTGYLVLSPPNKKEKKRWLKIEPGRIQLLRKHEKQ